MKVTIILTCISLLFFPGCSKNKIKEEIVFKIENKSISRTELNKVAQILRQGIIQIYPERAVEGVTPELLRSAAQQLIANHVLLREAKKRSIEVDSFALSQAFEKMIAQYPDRSVFNQQLTAMGETEASARERIREGLILDSLVKLILIDSDSVSETECQQFYTNNKERFFSQPRFRASQIAFFFDSTGAQVSKDAALASARKALDLLRNGKSIEVTLKEFSGNSNISGGDMGWFSKGDIRPDLEKVLDPLKINEVSEIVTSEKGFHVLQKTAQEEATPMTYAQVHDQVRRSLDLQKRNNRVSGFIDSLVGTTKIEYMDTTLVLKN